MLRIEVKWDRQTDCCMKGWHGRAGMETKLEGDSKERVLAWAAGDEGEEAGVRGGLRQGNLGILHVSVWNLLLCVSHFSCLQTQGPPVTCL